MDTLKGLHAYMNTMMTVNPDIMRFQLRRITHYWGVREKKYVYYMLAPRWIKLRIVRYLLAKSQLCTFRLFARRTT